jgi:hypothetical protein
VPAPSDDAEGARLPKLRLGVLHHQGRTLVHEGVSRARGRLEVRRLRYDGHGLALASRGQALRLRRPCKLSLALPLFTEVRGREILGNLHTADVHITPPQSPKARSSTQPHSMIDSYILLSWIDIRDRECFTATAALDRTTHVSCVALHSPVSTVASPTPRPSLRRHVYPCSVSS